MLCPHIDMPVCDDWNIEPKGRPGAVARGILLTGVEQPGSIEGIEGKQHRTCVVGIPCPRVQHPEHTIPQTIRRNSRGCCDSWETGTAGRFKRESSLVHGELTKGIVVAVAQHVEVMVPVGHGTKDAATGGGNGLHCVAVIVWLVMTHVVAVDQVDRPAFAGNPDQVWGRSRLGWQ